MKYSVSWYFTVLTFMRRYFVNYFLYFLNSGKSDALSLFLPRMLALLLLRKVTIYGYTYGAFSTTGFSNLFSEVVKSLVFPSNTLSLTFLAVIFFFHLSCLPLQYFCFQAFNLFNLYPPIRNHSRNICWML